MNLTNLQLNNQKKIVIVIFCVLIVYADFGYILKAQLVGLKKIASQISRLNKDLTNLNRGLEDIRLSKDNPDLIKQKKTIKSSKVLAESRISELLQEISSAANKLGIKIAQIRTSRQSQKEKPTIGQGKLASLLINLDLVCDYHNLGKFIQSLEDSPVFMGVQELKISTQLPDYMKQKVVLVLKTYVTK
jgi:Tfp pilus assembly protein PilO